jgi:hypothetical protein
MEKKKLKNKAVKKEVENKENNYLTVKQFNELPSNVEVIGLKCKHLKEGVTYPVTKETAILLINKGFAKLK